MPDLLPSVDDLLGNHAAADTIVALRMLFDDIRADPMVCHDDDLVSEVLAVTSDDISGWIDARVAANACLEARAPDLSLEDVLGIEATLHGDISFLVSRLRDLNWLMGWLGDTDAGWAFGLLYGALDDLVRAAHASLVLLGAAADDWFPVC